MIGELDLDGVFLSPALMSAVIAWVVLLALRRLLVAAGAYRAVWHPALFDTAVFFILWAVTATLPLPQWT